MSLSHLKLIIIAPVKGFSFPALLGEENVVSVRRLFKELQIERK